MISSKQLTEWMAFCQLEPFGFQADMLGHAITSSVIANSHRKKGHRAFSPFEFLPKEKELPTAKAFIANLKSILMFNRDKEDNGHNHRPATRHPRA